MLSLPIYVVIGGAVLLGCFAASAICILLVNLGLYSRIDTLEAQNKHLTDDNRYYRNNHDSMAKDAKEAWASNKELREQLKAETVDADDYNEVMERLDAIAALAKKPLPSDGNGDNASQT